jgi:Putative DNA-binding domain
MIDLLSKEEFTENDILDILASKLEESINIEFKNAAAISNIPSIKKEISKDVSSFANSDGGLIFYGIDEVNHIATSISYVDGNLYSKEWLENVITTTIQQRINDLRIIPVRFENGDISKTVYVIKIPKSSNSPHINADKRYYRRYNFQSVPMEEYEVRDSYLKYRESKVLINNVVVKLEDNYVDSDRFDFNIEVHIMSDGNYMAENYKIACNLNGFRNIRFYANRDYHLTNKLEDGYKISTKETTTLFPEEVLNALSFNISIPKTNFDYSIENGKIDFYIYSLGKLEISEGIDVLDNMKKIRKNVLNSLSDDELLIRHLMVHPSI